MQHTRQQTMAAHFFFGTMPMVKPAMFIWITMIIKDEI